MDSATKLKDAITLYNKKHNRTFAGDDVYQILGHCELMEDIIKNIGDAVKTHESDARHHFSGDIPQRISSLVGHHKHNAAVAISDKKQLIEDVLVYLRSVVMISESIGNAATHAEKSARLRGLIELLNSAIRKLRQEQTDNILNNWESFSWGYSDYPYRNILEKMGDMKREIERLKQFEPKDDLPM